VADLLRGGRTLGRHAGLAVHDPFRLARVLPRAAVGAVEAVAADEAVITALATDAVVATAAVDLLGPSVPMMTSLPSVPRMTPSPGVPSVSPVIVAGAPMQSVGSALTSGAERIPQAVTEPTRSIVAIAARRARVI
jgi:hypothetical protein